MNADSGNLIYVKNSASRSSVEDTVLQNQLLTVMKKSNRKIKQSVFLAKWYLRHDDRGESP